MAEMEPILENLIVAAKAGDWDRVDGELVPKLRGVDGNVMAREILDQITNSNPDVRDVLATSLAALSITDKEVFERAIDAMVEMAANDVERFPAGRAAMFLWFHRDNESLRDKIYGGIEKFKARSEIPVWKRDLFENIPGLVELLG